jgi:shikimate dehydrogenase
MSARRALRVVSSPARTLEAIRREIPIDARAGADVVEVRVDRLAADELDHLDRLFPAPLPLLGTLRSRSEGGEGPDQSAHRRELLARMSAQPFAFIDIESTRDSAAGLAVLPDAGAGRWVRSRHLSDSRHWEEEALALGASQASTAWTKIVLPASVGDLFDRILPALPAPGTAPFTVHTTGASGALLRAWADRLGMAAVYCAPPAYGAPSGPAVEPAQLPVDRLGPEAMGPSGPFFALLGNPTSHSRSPELHTRWMRLAHRKGVYVAADIASEDELFAAVAGLVKGGFRGFNITSPWKRAALHLASTASPEAVRVGGANTLTVDGERLAAANTDREAVARRLRELRATGVWSDPRLLVLGTGGAARAALDAGRELEAEQWIAGRDPTTAAQVASEFGAQVWRPDHAAPFSVVVHATTVGRVRGAVVEIPWADALARGSHVVDFVYAPADPIVAVSAREVGASYEDGERLLRYQAAGSYRLWWGEEPPTAPTAHGTDGP